MPYVRGDGQVVAQRSIFRLSIISDFFWAVVNTVGLFLDTLFNPTKPVKKKDFGSSRSSTSGSGGGGGGGGGGGPGPTMRRGPNIRGVDSVRACAPSG